MDQYYNKITSSPDIAGNDKYYWGYQYRLGKEMLVPMLKGMGIFRDGASVAEIGCAEGGVLMAFASSGASRTLGTDIQQERLAKAEEFQAMLGMHSTYAWHDIIEQEPSPDWLACFDIVLLRDVIEHLGDPRKALLNIKKMLKPGGALYVSFPPYWSPYGGHQHTVANFWGRLPFLHYLPLPLLKAAIASGRQNDAGEVLRLRTIRMTPRKFIESARSAGYSIARSDYYLLRPVFKVKFGLPAVRLPDIPLIRNLALEGSYVLKIN